MAKLSIPLPIYTRVGDVEQQIGQITVDVDAHQVTTKDGKVTWSITPHTAMTALLDQLNYAAGGRESWQAAVDEAHPADAKSA